MPDTSGGSFVLEAPKQIFTPEQFSEEHRAVARATREFWTREVVPQLEAIQQQDFSVLLRTLRRSAELGLVSTLVPERFGGMELDLTAALIVTEGFAGDASYSMCHGAQSGLGALPVLLFGTPAQKKTYLPRLASAELIAAYALSEAQSGSDALAVRTRADLSSDGSHYILNGQKMWITGGGFADLFTVFAKIGGEQFSAFLVERAWPGVSVGAEEKKMGLKGSSTTAVYFDNVRVPVENLLGEAGRGHIVALNVLNIGRLQIGASAAGKCREVLAESIAYANQRQAFGHAISGFGLIQHKLAEMAIRVYVTESMTYRVAGSVQERTGAISWDRDDAASTLMKAVEEFAAECSLVKVFASEALGYVTDEAVQIHGGYGYHQDYAVERAYRDARIYRIFEGTNEINRLAALTMLLKRARKGALPLAAAVKALDTVRAANPAENAKKVALLLLGSAYEAFGGAIEREQEIAAGITDVLMDAFAMESAALRATQCGRASARQMADIFAQTAMERIRSAGREVLGACCRSEALEAKLRALDSLTTAAPHDAIGLRRQIAARLIEAGRYVV